MRIRTAGVVAAARAWCSAPRPAAATTKPAAAQPSKAKGTASW